MPTWDVTFDLRVNVLDRELVQGVARAEAMAQVVRGIPIPPTIYERIDQLNIVRAVRGTTGIEGSNLTEEEVAKILSGPGPTLGQARAREEAEARNAADVMQYVAETLRRSPDMPLSEALIRELHIRTTQGIPYEHNTPGHYREHAVHAGEFVPPRSGDEVRRLMEEFIQWFNSGEPLSWPPLIRAIAAHFYFISIHPFGDGNGRTARAIESYLLYQAKINAVGFYSLSNFYYRNRPDYIEMLDFVRFKSGGDLTPFLKFAVFGLVDELEVVQEEILKAVTVVVFRDFALEQLAASGKLGTAPGNRMWILLQALQERPVSMADLRSGRSPLSGLWSSLTSKTLDRDLRFLQSKDLVVRDKGLLRLKLEVMQQFTR